MAADLALLCRHTQPRAWQDACAASSCAYPMGAGSRATAQPATRASWTPACVCARDGPSAGSRRRGAHPADVWDLANMFDWVTLTHLITRQTAPFECSAGSVPSRSSRTLRVGGAPCWRAAGLAVLAFASQDRLLAAATRTAPFPNERSLGITRPNNCSRARRSRLGCRGHGDSGKCSGGS